jgi:hypothetical protein
LFGAHACAAQVRLILAADVIIDLDSPVAAIEAIVAVFPRARYPIFLARIELAIVGLKSTAF